MSVTSNSPAVSLSKMNGDPQCLRRTLFGASLACLLFLPGVSRGDEPTMTLSRIISKVRANEALYRNIEIAYELRYTKNKKIPLKDWGPNRIPTMSSKKSTRVVLQNGLFYLKQNSFSVGSDKKKRSWVVIHGFDGKVTRVIEQKTGNIHKGRVRSARIPYANSIVFRGLAPQPLSRFMSTKEDPRSRGVRFEWKVVGEDTVTNLLCIRLRLQLKTEKVVAVEYDVWLAVERNYFPVKMICRAPALSRTLPTDITTFSDFRELSKGVWLPFVIKTVTNDGLSLMRGEIVLGNVYEWKIKKAALNPKYPIALFRDVTFPDGMLVYEVENGKIRRSYVQGEKTNPVQKKDQANNR